MTGRWEVSDRWMAAAKRSVVSGWRSPDGQKSRCIGIDDLICTESEFETFSPVSLD